MQYRIKPGVTLLDSDGSHKTGGDLIDLSDEFALSNSDKVELVHPTLEAATHEEGSGY